METYTDGLGVAAFTENAKNSFREIIKRMDWKLEENGDTFYVTYPIDDENLMDFLIDSMI